MVTFSLSIVLLIVGYLFYGKLVERIFGIDAERTTPAYAKQDGVDYIPMKSWRSFMIQFLNIAGLGPIFGAIMGAKFGTSSFLWIVFGSIFAGGVHDYISGMLSLRMDGAGLPEIHGRFLGNRVKRFMRFFTVFLLILVGAVFVSGPAEILATLTPENFNMTFWIALILLYYIIATLLPIDKLIGKIYPIFGFCLLFMAVGIMGVLFYYHPQLPEIWQGLSNKQPNANNNPIFPMMFVSIACGAISGFHATQSPLMARCLTNERQGRPIFYGAMIVEGIVALIWAAAASYLFYTPEGQALVPEGQTMTPAAIVHLLCNQWLGVVGAILAILGVVAAPISTGDTAFRSARLIVADALGINQKTFVKRLAVAIPLFVAGFSVLLYSLWDKEGFAVIWNGFSWANQFLAMVTLWAITVYLSNEGKCYWITLIPALFMSMVSMSFILISKATGFGLPHAWGYFGAATVTVGFLLAFFILRKNKNKLSTINK